MKKTQRFERRVTAAREDYREVMETYKQEIKARRVQRYASYNELVKQC